jgi:hypothetical protein
LRTYAVEWRDADLAGADLAPSRDYPPPAGIFGGVSGDVVFCDGCYGDTVNVVSRTDAQSGASYSSANVGNAIAISDPAKPESFPPDNYIFTADAPTCLIEGGGGIHWRFGKNSLGVIRYVGGSPALSYERIWTGIGVQNQHNACLGAGGRLYAFTGTRGAVRLGVGGEPDTIFASPVSVDMASWTPSSVVLGYDANRQYVLFMHSGTILAFHEPSNSWCAPCDVSSTLSTKTFRSSVTINGAAYLGAGSGSAISLYDYDSGSGTLGKVVSPWVRSSEVSDVISRILCAVRADTTSNNVTIKLYVNGSSSAIYNQNITLTSTGFQPLAVLRPNIRNAKIYRVEVGYTSAGGDAGFEGCELQGESQNISW